MAYDGIRDPVFYREAGFRFLLDTD